MKRTRKAALLYDADCCFCRWATTKILAWDRRGRIRPVRLQDGEARKLLPRMNEEARMASWHLVTPDGKVRSAGAAAEPLFRLLPGGRPLAGLASAFPRATERMYQWVARNRDRLVRRLGDQACADDPAARRTDSKSGG